MMAKPKERRHKAPPPPPHARTQALSFCFLIALEGGVWPWKGKAQKKSQEVSFGKGFEITWGGRLFPPTALYVCLQEPWVASVGDPVSHVCVRVVPLGGCALPRGVFVPPRQAHADLGDASRPPRRLLGGLDFTPQVRWWLHNTTRQTLSNPIFPRFRSHIPPLSLPMCTVVWRRGPERGGRALGVVRGGVRPQRGAELEKVEEPDHPHTLRPVCASFICHHQQLPCPSFPTHPRPVHRGPQAPGAVCVGVDRVFWPPDWTPLSPSPSFWKKPRRRSTVAKSSSTLLLYTHLATHPPTRTAQRHTRHIHGRQHPAAGMGGRHVPSSLFSSSACSASSLPPRQRPLLLAPRLLFLFPDGL